MFSDSEYLLVGGMSLTETELKWVKNICFWDVIERMTSRMVASNIFLIVHKRLMGR